MMKTAILFFALAFALPAHAQVVAPASFTLKLSSCTPAPPAPTAQFPQPDGSIVWGYLRIGDVWPCTITVPIAGTYTVSGLAGSAWSGTSFHFESPKGTSIGTLTAANTGAWSAYQPISTALTLPAGQVPLLLILDASAANLNDALTFTYVPPAPLPPFVFTLNGFGTFTFPLMLSSVPDCSDGTCSLVACNVTTNVCVTLLPGQSGNVVIWKSSNNWVVVAAP